MATDIAIKQYATVKCIVLKKTTGVFYSNLEVLSLLFLVEENKIIPKRSYENHALMLWLHYFRFFQNLR